jgi:hypothetical protein
MPDVVLVLLVELVVRHARAVHLAPERDGLVEREPDALEPSSQREYMEVVRDRCPMLHVPEAERQKPNARTQNPERAPCFRIPSTGSRICNPRSPLFASPEPRAQSPESRAQSPVLIQDPGSQSSISRSSPTHRADCSTSPTLPPPPTLTSMIQQLSRTHLEEQNQLQPPKVLEVVILLEPLIHVPHTWREMLLGNIIDHMGGDDRSRGVFRGLVLGRAETGEEGRGEVVDHGSETLVFV